ncbi:hypothetical protein [Barnesiella sp. An55]|uniref:hypothetical protein n=1 Tax=Barnesiella sp. An55 TaxID=1965646 RepID=UPI000B3719C7|nr:hypothetical protein [Barnesiella sp. An55]OUN73427.1 hypothetical protein B5G10_04600 [Barnesiella sp. An55]HIZ25907.1 hypothetical protein [Candidatus Barnesiella merdipullorum]
MRRLARCLCLLLLLAEAAGCKSTRQSTVSQHGQWNGEAEHSFTTLFDSVMRTELTGSTRWEWTQLDYSLDTLRPDAEIPRLRVTRLARTATVTARHERAVTDSLVAQSRVQVRARGEQVTHDERQTRTTGSPLIGAAVVIAIVLSIIYILKKR